MIKDKAYCKPIVLNHQPIYFETRHSWNPGLGNNPTATGNGGILFPVSSNPNPQPCGAGTAGNGKNNGNGNGNGNIGVGQCNPNVNP